MRHIVVLAAARPRNVAYGLRTLAMGFWIRSLMRTGTFDAEDLCQMETESGGAGVLENDDDNRHFKTVSLSRAGRRIQSRSWSGSRSRSREI